MAFGALHVYLGGVPGNGIEGLADLDVIHAGQGPDRLCPFFSWEVGAAGSLEPADRIWGHAHVEEEPQLFS